MVKNKVGKRRKGVLAILSISMLFVSSLAFFTDNKTNHQVGRLGSFSIATDLSYEGDLRNVAPGDSVDLKLGVSNTGSLDADLRQTYRVSVPEEDIGKYPLGGVSLSVDGAEVLSQVNTDVRVPAGLLVAGESTSYALDLVISNSLVNDVQSHNFKIEILTEAKQLNSPDWVELGTEEISFGTDTEFKVVPSTHMIKTASDNITREVMSEFGAVGYVRFFTNRVSRYTSDSLKDEFLNDQFDLNIYSPTGVLYAGSDIVETGAVVKLEVDGVLYDSLVFVSIGDLDDDGSIIASDMAALVTLVRIARGVDPGTISTKDFLAADLDNDGHLTNNDIFIMSLYLRGQISSFPLHYPSVPYGTRKPDLSISVGDNFVAEEDHGVKAWDLGNLIESGSTVSPGDILKVSVNIDNLRSKTIMGTDIELLFDSEHFEVVESVFEEGELWEAWLSGVEGGLAPAQRRNPSFSTYHSEVRYLANGTGLSLLIDGKDTYKQSTVSGNGFLEGSGSHQIIALKVKDNVPSGTELKISFGRLSNMFEGFGGITYSDSWTSNSSYTAIVK